MGFRFRRTISIAPGVRINLSNGCPSLSLGPRGASLTVGKQGTYANLGLPGSGLSYRTKLFNNNGSRSPVQQAVVDVDGLLQEAAQINGNMDWILNIHQETPSPASGRSRSSLLSSFIQMRNNPFEVSAPARPDKPIALELPVEPVLEKPGLFSRVFKSDAERQSEFDAKIAIWQQDVARCKNENEMAAHQYQALRSSWAEQYAQWQFDKNEHETNNSKSLDELTIIFDADITFFENVLGFDLSQLVWPRDTIVSYSVSPGGFHVDLDVDLPEVENIPAQTAVLNAKQNGLNIKAKTDKTLRMEYARHVHGCLFRLIGEAFCSLPVISVSVSGFTQRINKQTGNLEDEYILSCNVKRSEFQKINFDLLANVDPIASLETFDLRRNMTSTGLFKAISV